MSNQQALDHPTGQLDPGFCRLINFPNRIWLFGGAGVFHQPKPGKFESLREAFWHQTYDLISHNPKWVGDLDVPENHSGWWAFSGYDDLLTFERDACHLARAIILFPESPGSLAELGALAVDDSIVDRLLIVVQGKYLEHQCRESFLNLGPLKRVESLEHRCVIQAEGTELTPDDFDTIVEFMNIHVPNGQRTERFRPQNPRHKLLIIADLVDLLLIVRPKELLEVLRYFDVEMTEGELVRAAKLLEFFSLLQIAHWGNEVFYLRCKAGSQSWVDYTSRAGKPQFDRARFKIDRREIVINDRRKNATLERYT